MSALEGVPASQLAEMPLASPPPGIVSNFSNPPTMGTPFILCGGVLLPIVFIFFVVRIYTRVRIMRRPAWDDVTCSIAMLGTVSYYIIGTLSITKGKFGRHSWDLSVLDSFRPWNIVTAFIISWLSTLILPFAKLTFFIFYLHLFRPFRWLRILCYIGIVLTSTTFLSFLVTQLALDSPRPGESWLDAYISPRYFKGSKDLAIPIATTSFAMDIYIFVLPILGVSKLQMSPRRKVGVLLIFFTGSMACISSFLTLYYKIRLNGHVADSMWASMPVNITILTEMCVGVIVSSMPSLAKFVQHQFPGFSVVDSFLSFKSSLPKIRHDKVPRAMAPDWSSNEHIIQGPHFSDSDRPYKKLGNHLDRNDIELGNVSCVTARDEGNFAGATGDTDGIYIKRAWEQSYQKKG